MAKKKGYGCLVLIIALALLVLTLLSAGITAVTNTVTVSTAIRFGIAQYWNNIKQFHQDCYCVANLDLPLYEKVMAVSLMEKKKPLIIKPGKHFQLKGYIMTGHVTWLAVRVFDNNSELAGYVYIPEPLDFSTFKTPYLDIPNDNSNRISIKNRYFHEIDSQEFDRDRKNHENETQSHFKTLIKQQYNLTHVIGHENIQKIKENKELVQINFIDAPEGEAFFCREDDFKRIEIAYKQYVTYGFDPFYLQINDRYDSMPGSTYEPGLFYKIIENGWFKAVLALIIVILFSRIVRIIKG